MVFWTAGIVVLGVIGINISSTCAVQPREKNTQYLFVFNKTEKITPPPAMSGDRTAPPWLWLLLDVPTLSIRDRQNRNVERRHKLYVALPLTCLCLCCRRLLFHLCVVIQAARWDESTATSSSNYFAVKTHRIAWKKKKKVGSSLIPVSHGVPQFPVARACASLSGNNASFVFTFAHEKKTAPSHPAMISHIAALLLCGS